jgi:hypothetical protein
MQHYFRLQVLGVFAPGALLLLEVGYYAIPASARHGPLSLAVYLSHQTGQVSGGVLIGFGLIAIFSAYITGFVLRQTVWLGMMKLAREQRWEDLQSKVCSYYSVEAVNAVIALHPAICRSEGINADGFRRYAKVWLQQRRPELALDFLESEINIAFANAVPFALAPFIVFGWILRSGVAYWFIATTVSLAIAALLIINGARLRDFTEPYETIFNFLMAHWIQDEQCSSTADNAESGSSNDSSANTGS